MSVRQDALSAAAVAQLAGALLDATVSPETSLFAVEGFDSLAIVELVEALERASRREIPPALIVPETFATPQALADALAGAGAPYEEGVR
jgi:acyl carrier protein